MARRFIKFILASLPVVAFTSLTFEYWEASQKLLSRMELPDPVELEFKKAANETSFNAEWKGGSVAYDDDNHMRLREVNREGVFIKDELTFSAQYTVPSLLPSVQFFRGVNVRVVSLYEEPQVTRTSGVVINDTRFSLPLLSSSVHKADIEKQDFDVALSQLEFMNGVSEKVQDDRLSMTEQDPYYILAKNVYEDAFGSLKTAKDGTLIEPIRDSEKFQGDPPGVGVASVGKKRAKLVKHLQEGGTLYSENLDVTNDLNGRMRVVVLFDFNQSVTVNHQFYDENGQTKTSISHMVDKDGVVSAALSDHSDGEIAIKEIKPFLSRELVLAFGKAAKQNSEKMAEKAKLAPQRSVQGGNGWLDHLLRMKKGRTYVV